MSKHTPNPLSSLSTSIAAAVDAVAPSIVGVACGRRLATGVAWSPDEVVTVASAIGRGPITVALPDGAERAATLLGRDRTTDLALLKIELPEGVVLAPPEPETDDLRVGQLALALGRPGASVRATLGMLSAVGGAWRTPWGGNVDAYFEVDATLPRGFPGGPLVSPAGRLLGINSRGLVRGGTTIPVTTVRRVVEQLRSGGSTQRGWLGISFQAARLAAEDQEAAGQETGLVLTGVWGGSPAARSGLKVGDVLLAISDEPVARMAELLGSLEGRADQEVELTVLRGGAVLQLAATVGHRRR